MKRLILIGGAPGSGKTTYAKQLEKKYDGTFWTHHLEADMFFIQNGRYQFDPGKLSTVHQRCQKCTRDAMRLGTEMVIVSNCFTKEWEREFYLEEACRHEYEVEWVHMTGTYPNEHGVPEEKVQKMRDAFEPFTMNNYRKGYRVTPAMMWDLLNSGIDHVVRKLNICYSITEFQGMWEFLHAYINDCAQRGLSRTADREKTFFKLAINHLAQYGSSTWPISVSPVLKEEVGRLVTQCLSKVHNSSLTELLDAFVEKSRKIK